tara:strand:+ start:5236 stop:6270 length:1035 start_codon:yes stop_codon:yes gene_type:complete
MHDVLKPLISQFLPFAKKRMGFKLPPKLFLRGDSANADNPLGKTAFYDPEASSITLYVTDRHPKDVMRSLSHELVHHTQNCNGEFDDAPKMGEGYAQNDEHLREMEREAYEMGNMCFRDWEDSIKGTIYFESLQKDKGVKEQMSIKDWKNKEITTLLSEAWGFKFNTLQEFDEFNGTGEVQEEATEEIKEGPWDTPDPRKRRKPQGTGPRVEDEDEKKKQVAESEDTGASKGDESKTDKGEEDYTTKKGEELKTSGKGRGEKKGDEADINEDSGGEEEHVDERRARGRADPRIQRGPSDARARPLEEVVRELTANKNYTEDQVREALKRVIGKLKESNANGQKR